MRHMDKTTMGTSIDTILDLIGLMKDRCTLSKDLSGGMKRRLSIGIALIGDPEVNLIIRLHKILF
jgi:ABC-type multidrug transport system ATPase subunit